VQLDSDAAIWYPAEAESSLTSEGSDAMETDMHRAAKAQVVAAMLQGRPWHEAVAAAGLQMSRSTAYRQLLHIHTEKEAALIDGRHGHPTKLRATQRQWLEEYWQDRPHATCREAQVALETRFRVQVSQSHLSRTRPALGLNRAPEGAGKKSGVLATP
jgi:transposase